MPHTLWQPVLNMVHIVTVDFPICLITAVFMAKSKIYFQSRVEAFTKCMSDSCGSFRWWAVQSPTRACTGWRGARGWGGWLIGRKVLAAGPVQLRLITVLCVLCFVRRCYCALFSAFPVPLLLSLDSLTPRPSISCCQRLSVTHRSKLVIFSIDEDTACSKDVQLPSVTTRDWLGWSGEQGDGCSFLKVERLYSKRGSFIIIIFFIKT